MKLHRFFVLTALCVLLDLRFASFGAVPDSLALSEFARIMTAFSESPGHFPGDNFVTNESSYLHVVPTVIELGKRGGVYIGVGTGAELLLHCRLEAGYRIHRRHPSREPASASPLQSPFYPGPGPAVLPDAAVQQAVPRGRIGYGRTTGTLGLHHRGPGLHRDVDYGRLPAV